MLRLRPGVARLPALLLASSLGAALAGCADPGSGKPAPLAAATAPASSGYAELLRAAKRDPASADYTALRLAYARSPDYNPLLGGEAAHGEVLRAMNASDWAAALSRAQGLLDQYWLDGTLHVLASRAARETGDAPLAAMHASVSEGLARSLASSGNMRSPATAITVINVGEEYFILRMLGLRLVRQALITENGRRYDRLDVVDRGGATQQLFFNVDLPFSAYGRVLSPNGMPTTR